MLPREKPKKPGFASTNRLNEQNDATQHQVADAGHQQNGLVHREFVGRESQDHNQKDEIQHD